MSKKKNILVINGREYDAVTGLPMDGKVSKPKPRKEATKKQANKPTQKPKTTKSKTKKAHKPAKDVAAHKPKHAITLNRRGVKKPSKSLKRSIRTQGHVETISKFPTSTISVKKSVKKVDKKLLLYAKRIHRSPLIKHFSSVAATDLNKSSSSSSNSKPVAPPKLSSPKTVYSKQGKPKTTEELLEYAISQATSHEQKPPPKKSRNPLRRKS